VITSGRKQLHTSETAEVWADFKQRITNRAIQTNGKKTVGLCYGRKTARQTPVVTSDSIHCSDRITV